jgi:hypothetical protein
MYEIILSPAKFSLFDGLSFMWVSNVANSISFEAVAVTFWCSVHRFRTDFDRTAIEEVMLAEDSKVSVHAYSLRAYF